MSWIVLHLREGHWLSAERALAWCRVLALMSGIFVLGTVVISRGGIDGFGKPLGTDFVCFWTASKLALAGHAGDVYQPGLHQAAQHALFAQLAPAYIAFFYPPTFLLLCLPLALLPYLPSLAIWMAAGLGVLLPGLWRLLPRRWAVLPMLAFPAVLDTLGHGQNGFITAACFGWSAVLRGRRPFLAGVCLGCLVIKPNLLLAAPVALLAGRHWRMIAGAMLSGCTIILLSWLAFGGTAWLGFLQQSALTQATLEQGLVQPWKMQSVFAATRLAQGGVTLAYALQAATAVVALGVLAHIIQRRPSPEAEGALLVLATMLCTPFLLDYDLTSLAVPIAWVASGAQCRGWRAWEKTILLAAYVLPLVARPLAMISLVAVAPAVIAALFAVTARRATHPDAATIEF